MANNATDLKTSVDKNSTSKSSPFAPPQISMAKGGGAIRDIDEKFTTNPATGTGSLTIAIPVSPGRSGFDPKLKADGKDIMRVSLALREARGEE